MSALKTFLEIWGVIHLVVELSIVASSLFVVWCIRGNPYFDNQKHR